VLLALEYILIKARHLGRQMSHLSVHTKLDTFFNPALLRLKTSTTSEPSVDEHMYCLFLKFFSYILHILIL
jgi:hypothetical protein